jgi:hypothetical protein
LGKWSTKKPSAKTSSGRKSAAKKTPRKKTGVKKNARKSASKRELIAPRGDKRYIRREARGRVSESEDVGRSLSQDRRRKAKKAARPGQGDRGHRKPSKSSTRKKSRAKR